LADVDWEHCRAFGLGMNGLYLNLEGREKYGIVQPGQEQEELINELITRLESVRDVNGRKVIRKIRRADTSFSGSALSTAPDLIVGYHREYRASWKTVLGGITDEVLTDNTSAWGADHCVDAAEVPGVLFSNTPVTDTQPALTDLAPSILRAFGLNKGPAMTGKNVFKTV
jgi:predicted AlkP superfamily phosphohydrolase/phosphomutase